MIKFDDQLYDDLMREHGAALARVTPRPVPPPPRVTPRRAVLAGGGFLAAAGVIAGTLVTAGSASPAYAVTKNPDGTLSLAVYQASGFGPANTRLRQLGDGKVVVVPVRPGCPRPPRVSGRGHLMSTSGTLSADGKVTVRARGIPAGDILVVGIERTRHGTFSTGILTSPPAPSCVSPPPSPPVGPGGSRQVSG